MNRTTSNVIALAAVALLVASAAWFRSRRASDGNDRSPTTTEAASGTGELASDDNDQDLFGSADFVGAIDIEEEPDPAEAKAADATQTGIPRLVDLGATECIPCKKLAPILEELREEYRSRLDVVFIDVWKDPAAKTPYNIRLIPTQVLFDAKGKELWRHEGFISKEELKTVFADKAGVE